MLPFEAEPLEKLRARADKAVAKAYNTHEVQAKLVERPGAQRQHVFDFEDGVRAIASVDWDSAHLIKPHLHVSFSLRDWLCMDLPSFYNRVEAIPLELWPDTIFVVTEQFLTECAVHVLYDLPVAWVQFLPLCNEIHAAQQRTGSPAH